MSSESLFVGLMTGTSLDGVDAVLASVTHAGTRVLAHHGSDLPSALRADLFNVNSPGSKVRAPPRDRARSLRGFFFCSRPQF